MVTTMNWFDFVESCIEGKSKAQKEAEYTASFWAKVESAEAEARAKAKAARQKATTTPSSAPRDWSDELIKLREEIKSSQGERRRELIQKYNSIQVNNLK
jgi:hypothetical protein